MDDKTNDYTFNEQRNEEDRWLREHGYNPDELSDEERKELLDHDKPEPDADNDELSDVVPGDEKDGTS